MKHPTPHTPITTPLSIPYNLSILRKSMNSNCHCHQGQTTQAGKGGVEEVGCGAFEEKCLLGGNALQIGRIYSNDSYLETAEESLCESTDPQQRRQTVQSPPLANQDTSSLKQSLLPTLPSHFQKYQSDLQKEDGDNILNREARGDREGTGLDRKDSVIMEEERESNPSLSFEGHTLSLQIHSIVKPNKHRLQHSILLPHHTPIPDPDRNRTLQDCTVRGQEGGLSESRAPKNACLKKKMTLPVKEGSEVSFQQEEENWLAKSSRKVNFKGEENHPPAKHSPERTKKPPQNRSTPNTTPKKGSKRVESFTSICLSGLSGKGDPSEEDGTASLLKSSRTLHDLGNNHLIYRLRGDRRNARACQTIQVGSREEERREAEIVALMRRHPHRNILRVHAMSSEPRGDRTLLLQTIDFYPRNLHQYLADLAQTTIPADQRAFQRKLILFQVLKGLHFLHNQQITHRNLTPASILISDTLQVAIGGFSSLDSPILAGRTGLRCEWLIRPPEVVLQPQFQYGSPGDVWEFGCLAVFMLRGRMPFEEYSDSGLIVEMSRCIGRPTAEDRAAIGLSEPHKFLFPNFRRESMGKSFRCQEQDLVELLRRVFVFNPYKRATAAELMQSRYFDDLRRETTQGGISQLPAGLLQGMVVTIQRSRTDFPS